MQPIASFDIRPSLRTEAALEMDLKIPLVVLSLLLNSLLPVTGVINHAFKLGTTILALINVIKNTVDNFCDVRSVGVNNVPALSSTDDFNPPWVSYF